MKPTGAAMKEALGVHARFYLEQIWEHALIPKPLLIARIFHELGALIGKASELKMQWFTSKL